jgi:hypothetical protein
MQRFTLTSAVCGVSLLAALLPLAPAAAQVPPAARRAPALQAPQGTDEAVQSYWTADRLAHARMLDLRVTTKLPLPHRAPLASGARQIVHGNFPTAAYDPDLAVEMPGSVGHADAQGLAKPLLTGSSGQPYTTNKLYPSSGKALYQAYPYGTVGHLFFTEPSGDYQCSASVIRYNVIATAGHCVADGNGNYYTNWLFIPGESGTTKPFGSWSWANADTSSAWYFGGGGVPNEQDDALIILNTRKIKGVVHRVGDFTGDLGYEYNAPIPNAITQLGYPCNLDGCADPVATYAQVSAGPSNTYLWGSATQGGGSGGPEIQDFGQAPSGVPAEAFGGNILVGSFSFYYTANGFYEDGASILYAPGQNGEFTFGDLINWACTGTSNC